MNRLDRTGVGAALHISILEYEAELLTDHVEQHPEMSGFSKAVNAAVQQYFLDRIEIIQQEIGEQ